MTALSSFGVAALSALAGILSARLLGSEGRGELAAALVWAGVLGTIAQVGLPQALTYYAARSGERSNHLFATALALAAIQSLVVVTLAWFVVAMILGRSQPQAIPSVQLYLLSIPCSLVTTYLSTLAQGQGRFGLFNALRVLPSVLYVVVLSVATFTGEKNVRVILLSLVLSHALVAAVALWWSYTHMRPAIRADGTTAGQLLAYGLKSYGANLSWLANARLDQFVMSGVVSLAQLGIYAVAVSYATVLFPLSGAFAMVLFPRVARDAGTRQAWARISKSLLMNLVISGAGGIVLGLLCPVLLPLLFGAQFGSAVYPAIVLLAGSVVLGCNYILSDGMRGMGYPAIPSLAEGAGLAVTVLGLLVLLPAYGIVAAAWVSVLSYAIVLIVLLISLQHVKRTKVQVT